MPARTLTRFHTAGITALLLGGLALGFGRMGLFVGISIGIAALIGFGVAVPRFRFFGPFICQGSAGRRWIALTFDDGPDEQSTPALLDLLRDAGVKAAFFAIGRRVAVCPELAARIVREGHLLENHSYSHSYRTNLFTVAKLRSELMETQTTIEKTGGVSPRCFRPPMGLSNPRVFRVARELDLKVIGWTARGLDTKLTDPKRIVNRITRRLKPGAIVLLHDGHIPPERLIPTVKLLLESVQAMGYEVVRLDRLLG